MSNVILIFLTAFSMNLFATDSRGFAVPYGDGMPAPWPFPWAKECPVEWSMLSGEYELKDSVRGETVSLRVSILWHNGMRLLRIARYDREGHLTSDGFTLITENQRTIMVYLQPMVKGEPAMWASLRFYYDSLHSCDQTRLVPILSFSWKDTEQDSTVENHYRLVKP